VSAIPAVAFLGSIDGHLRAYSTKNGTILWDFDTLGRYKTVDGVDARGGSLDGAGPAVANGMLFVNSGYPSLEGCRVTYCWLFLWTENSRIGPSLRDQPSPKCRAGTSLRLLEGGSR
jgi:PQQ enzyme repeat